MTSTNAICDCRTVNDQGGPLRFWPCPVHGDGTPAPAPARCRTCGFTDCPGATTPGGCTRWPATDEQDADLHGVTFLTYTQLLDALTESKGIYEERFTEFMAAADAAKIAAEISDGARHDLRAEMDTRWAACTAQAAMTRAITAEITARIRRRDYA